MKGMGKGLVGAVVKPAAGVLDLASDVSSGIKATATGAGANRALRARPPRAPFVSRAAQLLSGGIGFFAAIPSNADALTAMLV
eukprot:COSAG02_NODE_38517_length_428_cov_0.781155_1_plen_83_part_10